MNDTSRSRRGPIHDGNNVYFKNERDSTAAGAGRPRVDDNFVITRLLREDQPVDACSEIGEASEDQDS